jgi:hypothetical protein
MGCIASGTTVCIMMPLDTIKTRLVTQLSASVVTSTPYKGIIDCAIRIAKEEGMPTFYKGLAPRLLSVMPMIGIQFGVYEATKRAMLYRTTQASLEPENNFVERYGSEEVIKEAAMEVSASQAHPYPAPHFLKRIINGERKSGFFANR